MLARGEKMGGRNHMLGRIQHVEPSGTSYQNPYDSYNRASFFFLLSLHVIALKMIIGRGGNHASQL